ncbi:unnamed protein product [Parnassius apollo]|uniref:(apollo) hypothetical protein n=1 Tax=Parnassius apollo TaxID=110799 RepID=A0A8S3W9S8_PARAO|nr:unnamed protein product [Parnassius apollo]
MAYNNLKLCLLIFCLAAVASGQHTPTISHITQAQIRDIGGSVDLECSVKYAQDYPVLWMKYDKVNTTEAFVLSSYSTLIIRDSRFSIRFDAASATYTLSIKDIQEIDAGWYQCQVLLSVSNRITAEVELQVRRPPIISDNSTRSPVVNEGGTSGLRTPTISHITQEQIRDIGGSVDLDCSVHHAQDYPVLWMKYDKLNTKEALILSSNSALIIRDSRLSTKFDAESSTYTLSIKDVQETDAGWYQCQVLLSVSNKITAEVELQVRRPPIISDNSTRSVTVSEGGSVQMECYADGFPSPKISWRRENNAILPVGGSIYWGNILKLNSVHKEDRGTYYCVAENGETKRALRKISLQVEFAPVVTVERPRLGQALQYDMYLECRVEAYPLPAISWFKDEAQLSNNQHYSISHFSTADEVIYSTLRVLTIEKDQYGLFTCRAQNKLGYAEGQVELFETITPVCPPACGQLTYHISAAPARIEHLHHHLASLLACALFLITRIFNTGY